MNSPAKFLHLLIAGLCTLASVYALPSPDAIVAADGTGQYTSIQQAINGVPPSRQAGPRWVILVKPGVYHERVYVQRERGNILLEGEDASRTIVTYSLNAHTAGPDGKPIGTFRTPTLQVDGDGFEARNLTIANGAGPVGQALALRVDADRVVFRGCRFLGWQDTILANRGRQYFEHCTIEGHVDFIFGGATAYFDHCDIHCLRDGYITAASTPKGQAHGFVFADCDITGAPGVKTYLGRPWRDYASVVFLRTHMSDVVRPEGWFDWKKPEAHHTTRYAEFENSGPGADLTHRVKWERRLESGAAAGLTPEAVLAGTDGWDPDPRPTLHLAGDSTMADKPDLAFPERGWGQLLREFVRPPWRLVNHAVNGRSAKSFRDEGLWRQLLAQLHKGDWVLVEFGHNDEKSKDPTRYSDPQNGFPARLRTFVKDVRERGAHPILATPIVRRAWDASGHLKDTHGAYLDAVRRVAAEDKVPLLDMEALTRGLVTRLGPVRSKRLYMIFGPGEQPLLPKGRTDNTHLRETGARMVAALAVQGLKRLGVPLAEAFDGQPIPAHPAWVPDRGDGTYRNPVLNADYSDPDAVRVGGDYWLVSSSFDRVPGLPLLHSRDLVNWELAGHALKHLVPEADFHVPHPGDGVWAPAIRYHDGRYWIYYPDPDRGIYLVTAENPRGPWSEPILVAPGRGLIDPCPLWDDDGNVYLIHAWAKSRAGINNELTLLRLAPDGRSVAEDLGVVVDGNKLPGYSTLEGPKLYKRDGWYYIFAPAGGVTLGWQAVFRSRSIRGPYEERRVLAQGTTAVNGPHQGALVDTPEGGWWFLHFQDRGVYGRVVHLEPVVWRDGWPVIGKVPSGGGVGEPVLVHTKPAVPPQPRAEPATSDEFDSLDLAPQWQWTSNPVPGRYSLTQRPGRLSLHSQVAATPNLWTAPYLLLQKLPAAAFVVSTKLDFSSAGVGDRAGLIMLGMDYAWVGLRRTASGFEVVETVCRGADSGHAEAVVASAPVPSGQVTLRLVVAEGGRCRFAYRCGDEAYRTLGDEFTATQGRWVGAAMGLFADGRSPAPTSSADFAWFRVSAPGDGRP